jgi:hypothetical protein
VKRRRRVRPLRRFEYEEKMQHILTISDVRFPQRPRKRKLKILFAMLFQWICARIRG